MNIYKSQQQRLGCFRAIKLEDVPENEDEKVMDASSYETYLDQVCKKLNAQQPPKPEQPAYTFQPFFNIGVCETPCHYRPRAGSDVIKSIVYNKMMEMSLKRQQNEASFPVFQDLPPLRGRGGAKEAPVPCKKNLKVNSNIFKPSFVPKIWKALNISKTFCIS